MTPTPVAERTTSAPSHSTVRAPRRFDVHTVPSVESEIAEIRSTGAHRVAVDCSEVSFIDVTAVDSLVGAGRDAHRSSLRIVNPSSAVLITLELLGHSEAIRQVAA